MSKQNNNCNKTISFVRKCLIGGQTLFYPGIIGNYFTEQTYVLIILFKNGLYQLFFSTKEIWFHIKLRIQTCSRAREYFLKVGKYRKTNTYSDNDSVILFLMKASVHFTQTNSQMFCLKIHSSCTDQAVGSCNRCNIPIRTYLT